MFFPTIGSWNVRGFNHAEKVLNCKSLIKSFKLDMLCLLETRIHSPSLDDPFFKISHSLFPNEESCHNFHLTSSGRIWIKWDSSKLCFTPNVITKQMINGNVLVGNCFLFQLTIVYAANNVFDRKALWLSIGSAAPPSNIPWSILGDFNCCRFGTKKSGGSPLHHYNLVDINSMIFDNGLLDLHSVGSFYTWYNQQSVNPIFIKLDRVLVNDQWKRQFPSTFYSFQSSSCSDHSPAILHPGLPSNSHHRFMFKNFWTKQDSYWCYLLNAFSLPLNGNPLSHLSNVLKQFKGTIKNLHWANSHFLNTHLDVLQAKQLNILELIQDNPLDVPLISSLRESNLEIANATSMLSSWIIQRAKSKWLHHGFIPSGMKATALAIIPKHRNASSISDYRPISLCNTIYKIIAKVIADRLKPILPLIVKDTQAGFVKSRISTDSILLANDILSFVNKRGTGNMFCAKIDIRKAFDSVSREFLLARLLQKGFPRTFISWIKACISNVNFSVVIDGALEGFFPSSAGLRQGCPLSPYLFCLVMDSFSNLLDARGFKGFSTENFNLSHLLYADDVLIFGEASLENCRLLSSILKDFGNASGLHVNYDKCSVMFSKNQRNQDILCDALSIHNICSKISYLGIPISFNRLKVADFLPLMDSLHKKFTGWKANLLSLAGRLQYLKFTIQDTIAYWIRGSILPKTVFKFFEKTCSRFLFFGDITSINKLHMVSWENVCKPKEKGGLGIPSLHAIQFAFNCSVIHRMYNCISPLSVWLTSQYTSPWRPPNHKASKFWISVCHTASSVKPYFKFVITPNAPISLFWDHWCYNNTLQDFVGNIPMEFFSIPLQRHYIANSAWNFAAAVPQQIRDKICNLPISSTASPCLILKDCVNVKFKDFIEEFYCSLPSFSWHNFVWHRKNVLKHSVFVWLALVGGLKTQDALRIRNINVPVMCSFCSVAPETVNHIFFECNFTFYILNSLLPITKNFLLRPIVLHLMEWLESEFSGALLYKEFFMLMIVAG
ncbi:uncharacterized protein LOC110102125 [Dendrobium catenatum]|uniref:uncharacterized protein LOC110102125 n=1 Tax=Dendrobium catenatum TaxID=906689 RepID=UPI0009F56DAF|nr:uncharacterized protein LOC110102125 [Dendrobium catenatum]